MIAVRKIILGDLEKGFLDVLGQISPLSKESKELYQETFKKRAQDPLYTTYVALHNDRVIGTGTLLLEHKFFWDCRHYGHLEDVVVDEKYRRQGIGKTIVDALFKEAKNTDCFRIICECPQNTVPFFEKFGLIDYGKEMHIKII